MDSLRLNVRCIQTAWLPYLYEEELLLTLSEICFCFFTRVVTSVKIHVKLSFHIDAK